MLIELKILVVPRKRTASWNGTITSNRTKTARERKCAMWCTR